MTRGILVEPFVGQGPALPVDHKFYVMHGRVAAVQVHLDPEKRHRWVLLDRHWRPLGRSAPPGRPVALDAMIGAAKKLAAGFDFARIDLYDVAPHPRFGEITFYPGSGLDPFETAEIDLWLGLMWRDKPRGNPPRYVPPMNECLTLGSAIRAVNDRSWVSSSSESWWRGSSA